MKNHVWWKIGGSFRPDFLCALLYKGLIWLTIFITFCVCIWRIIEWQFNTKQNHEIHGENVINGKQGKYCEGNEFLDQILIQKERLQYISEKMSNIAKEFWYKAIFFEGETRGNAGYGLPGELKMIMMIIMDTWW